MWQAESDDEIALSQCSHTEQTKSGFARSCLSGLDVPKLVRLSGLRSSKRKKMPPPLQIRFAKIMLRCLWATVRDGTEIVRFACAFTTCSSFSQTQTSWRTGRGTRGTRGSTWWHEGERSSLIAFNFWSSSCFSRWGKRGRWENCYEQL